MHVRINRTAGENGGSAVSVGALKGNDTRELANALFNAGRGRADFPNNSLTRAAEKIRDAWMPGENLPLA